MYLLISAGEMGSRRIAGILVFATFLGAGCSVKLAPEVRQHQGPRYDDTVAVEEAAHGMPRVIGHGTLGQFAVEIIGVKIKNGAGEKLVMNLIKEVLRSHGYQVVEPQVVPDAPMVRCSITRFHFKNYTWFFPIVPTWGGIDLELLLLDRDRKVLWRGFYSGSSWNLWYSFGSAVNKAMEEILEEATSDLAGPEFRKACCE